MWVIYSVSFTAWQLTSSRVGDPRESEGEFAMSFITQPWKLYTVILAIPYSLGRVSSVQGMKRLLKGVNTERPTGGHLGGWIPQQETECDLYSRVHFN